MAHDTTIPPRVSFQQDQKPDQQKKYSWLSSIRKNQPQWNALCASSLIFVSGGMSLAWGAGFAVHSVHRPCTPCPLELHMQISWYAAAIIGAIVSALLTHRTPQRPVYIISSCLVLMCGVLYVTLPQRTGAIIAARYLDGMANGLAFVPTLSTVGEMSVCEMRGVLAAAVEQLSCNFGIFIMLFYTAIWQNSWNVNTDQLHGLVSIFSGVTALALSLTLCVESPVFLLLRRNEQSAVVALRHLQRPLMVTSETFVLLNEHKSYVAHNEDLSWCQSTRRSLVPLLKLTVYRSLHALSLTPVVWLAMAEAASRLTPEFHTWPFVVFGILRWLGSCSVVFLMDCVGRKRPTLFGLFASGSFAIAFATLFERRPHMISALSMMFSYQFFTGVAYAASSVYLTEAFPLSVKPYFVAIVYMLEQLIRIGLCCFTPNQQDIAIYFYAIAIISIVYFLLGIFILPETKHTTLTRAHIKLRQFFNEDF